MPKKQGKPKPRRKRTNKVAPEFAEHKTLEFKAAFAMFDIDGGGSRAAWLLVVSLVETDGWLIAVSIWLSPFVSLHLALSVARDVRSVGAPIEPNWSQVLLPIRLMTVDNMVNKPKDS